MKKTRVYVAGHKGMVGSALVRFLEKQQVEIITKDRAELDLLNQSEVQNFFKNKKIDQVYIAAGKVGGIKANILKPAEFIYENIMIQSNIIHTAFLNKIKKLLFISSSCIYPKSNQPIKEDSLLCGALEKSVEPYAIAKIAGVKLCETYNNQFSKKYLIDYRSIVPNNLYGPGDNYDLENSHVVAAFIRKFHDAKIKKKPKVILWGSGKPKREFLYLNDFIESCFFMMNINKKFVEKKKLNSNYVNVGSGEEVSIFELAQIIKKIIKFDGKIEFDSSKPNGVLRKFLDTSKIRDLGWKPKVLLINGLKKTYEDFKKLI